MTSRQPITPSLDALLAAVQRGGDVAAWRALVARLTPQIYRVARGLTAWRVLGAQTIVEHAWRAAMRQPEAVTDGAALRRQLLVEVVGRALALGDSPRDSHPGATPARLAAMRAVALLPHPARAVLVLADVGGVPLADVATLLSLPDARLKAELWHARLALETLRGAGATPAPLALAALDVAASDDENAAEGASVAALWYEAVPDALLDRLANDLHDRRQRRRLAPHVAGRRLTVLGGLITAVVLAASAALWREAPRLARNLAVPAGRPTAPVTQVGRNFTDSTRLDRLPAASDRPSRPPVKQRGEQIAHRQIRPDQPGAAD